MGRRKGTLKKRQRKHSNPFPFRNCQVTLTEVTEYPQKPSLLHQHGPYGVDRAGCGARARPGAPPGTPSEPKAPGETAYCGRGGRESPHVSNTAQWAGAGRTRYKGPPRRFSFLLVKHTLMDRAARRMQPGVGIDVLWALRAMGMGAWAGGQSKWCRDDGTLHHTGTSTRLGLHTFAHSHTGHVHLHIHPSTRGPHTISRSYTHLHTHITHVLTRKALSHRCAGGHVQMPKQVTCTRVHAPPHPQVW